MTSMDSDMWVLAKYGQAVILSADLIDRLASLVSLDERRVSRALNMAFALRDEILSVMRERKADME